MNHRSIGTLKVSEVGIGCNNFGRRVDATGTLAVVDAAIDAGINFFDTADAYGSTKSEEFLGRAVGARRDRVVIATKFGLKLDAHRRGARPEYVHQAADDSLKRLGTDYIDLYQLHTPDATVPIADTLGAMNELITQGKVREIGCSNFSVVQLREATAAKVAGAKPLVSVQNEYSLFHREPEQGVLAECTQLQMGFIPYFPLANGLLTGKYRRGQPAPTGSRISAGSRDELLTDENLDRIEDLVAFASTRDHTLLELAFSWLLSRAAVSSVIAGATTPEQVTANASAGNWVMTDPELEAIDKIVSSA